MLCRGGFAICMMSVLISVRHLGSNVVMHFIVIVCAAQFNRVVKTIDKDGEPETRSVMTHQWDESSLMSVGYFKVWKFHSETWHKTDMYIKRNWSRAMQRNPPGWRTDEKNVIILHVMEPMRKCFVIHTTVSITMPYWQNLSHLMSWTLSWAPNVEHCISLLLFRLLDFFWTSFSFYSNFSDFSVLLFACTWQVPLALLDLFVPYLPAITFAQFMPAKPDPALFYWIANQWKFHFIYRRDEKKKAAWAAWAPDWYI